MSNDSRILYLSQQKWNAQAYYKEFIVNIIDGVFLLDVLLYFFGVVVESTIKKLTLSFPSKKSKLHTYYL